MKNIKQQIIFCVQFRVNFYRNQLPKQKYYAMPNLWKFDHKGIKQGGMVIFSIVIPISFAQIQENN